MLNKTSKRGKEKQGIKDLDSKDGHILLNALQSSQLKVCKANLEKIKTDSIAVITTASPTTSDAPEVCNRALYASGRI